MMKLWMAPVLAAGLVSLAAPPAEACLTCGCSGSGISGDVGGGGNAFLFSNCLPMIVQQGLSYRSVTGSFTETGAWNPTPTDGRLDTLQGTLSAMYFPNPGMSFSISLPMVANRLDRATWGPLGSVAPTDRAGTLGYGVGDVGLQGSMKLFETGEFGLGSWVGASVPSGRAIGDPADLSGAGVFNAQGGLVALGQLGHWQLSGNLGLQRPLTAPPLNGSTFYVGNAWMYQAMAAYIFNKGALENVWSAGMGLQGFTGEGRFGPNDVPFTMRKLRIVPTLQYEWNIFSGVRVSAGFDPNFLGANAMTDYTIMTSVYQGFTL